MLVNSRTPGVAVRVFHRESRHYFLCEEDRTEVAQVAFNMRCASDLPPGEATATFDLVRNRAERLLRQITITTYVP